VADKTVNVAPPVLLKVNVVPPEAKAGIACATLDESFIVSEVVPPVRVSAVSVIARFP
jgi:hypothetical protein